MIISTVNHLSQEVQHIVITMTSSNIVQSSENNHNDYLRQQFYELVLLKPYLVMNYGTVDINKVGKTRIKKFLILDMKNENYYENLKMTVDEEIEQYHNIYMKSILLDFKIVIAFISPIITMLVAMPFFVLSLANLIIDILVLIFIVVFPVFLVLSLLNLFSDKALKGCTLCLSLFILKVVLSLTTLILFMLMQLSSNIIPINLGSANYLLNALLIVVVYCIIYRYRAILLQITSGGLMRVQTTTNYSLGNIHSNLKIENN